MHDASYGITAALAGHRRGHGRHQDHRRVRADDGDELADVHPQPHPARPRPSSSWPPGAGTSTGRRHPTPCTSRCSTPRLLRRAVATMLDARQRRGGGDLHRVPPVGRAPAANPANQASLQQGAPGRRRRPGTPSPRRCRRTSRAGSCTSRWPAPCFSTASTRPGSHPRATRTRRAAQWLRVRKLDNVHLCPEGSARYADAAAGRHDGGLPSGPRQWELVPGGLDDGPELQQPARGVPGRPSPRLAVQPVSGDASGLRSTTAADGALGGRSRLGAGPVGADVRQYLVEIACRWRAPRVVHDVAVTPLVWRV